MELWLFIIIGAVAIIAAAMMLISENAIYSTLFLILNFACIAFFFLMLNAAFVAMVQIAVYAGAIMVLFLFVIMLLGAERVLPEAQPRFRWLTPAAIILALVFLAMTTLAIVKG
ncbi:MAG: NADH-quinone oxidoreductase subunit J, partial [Anaerolineae bacterium]|nr:NADH-quinone oxidoreductase subunit J [Anaerolineae bacterium]